MQPVPKVLSDNSLLHEIKIWLLHGRSIYCNNHRCLITSIFYMMHLTHRVEMRVPGLISIHLSLTSICPVPLTTYTVFIMCFVKMGFYFSNSPRLILFSIMMTSLL